MTNWGDQPIPCRQRRAEALVLMIESTDQAMLLRSRRRRFRALIAALSVHSRILKAEILPIKYRKGRLVSM